MLSCQVSRNFVWEKFLKFATFGVEEGKRRCIGLPSARKFLGNVSSTRGGDIRLHGRRSHMVSDGERNVGKSNCSAVSGGWNSPLGPGTTRRWRLCRLDRGRWHEKLQRSGVFEEFCRDVFDQHVAQSVSSVVCIRYHYDIIRLYVWCIKLCITDIFMHYLDFSFFIHTAGSSILWHTCTLCMPCFILCVFEPCWYMYHCGMCVCILYEMSTDLDPWRVQMEFHVIYVLLMRDEMCVFDCICVLVCCVYV